MVPAGGHRKASAAGEVETEGGKIIRQQKKNSDWNNDGAEVSETQTQRLRDGADHVNGIGRDVSENRAGGQDVNDRNRRGGDEDRPRYVAGGVTRFSGKDGNVFKSAERAEGHLAEYADSEDGQRRGYKAQRMKHGQATAP